MMRAATILRWPVVGLLMLAAPALAQWPSWSRPMEKSFDRGNQALSSAVERLTVSVGPQAWTNYITTNLWASYFSQGTKLKASKNMLKAAVDSGGWVRPVSPWHPTSSIPVTASNLLVWAGAPSGWWTNHPYVNVAGVSNGWRFWPDVASNVQWQAKRVEYYPEVCTNAGDLYPGNIRPDDGYGEWSSLTNHEYPTIFRATVTNTPGPRWGWNKWNARGHSGVWPSPYPYREHADSWKNAKDVFSLLLNLAPPPDDWDGWPPANWPVETYPMASFAGTIWNWPATNSFAAVRPTYQIAGGCYPKITITTNYVLDTNTPVTKWVDYPLTEPTFYTAEGLAQDVPEIVTNGGNRIIGWTTNLYLQGSRYVFWRKEDRRPVYEYVTNLVTTNWVGGTNIIITTNWLWSTQGLVETFANTTNVLSITAVTNGLRYIASKAAVSSVPYVGNIPDNPWPVWSRAMPPLATNIPKIVDIWIKFIPPYPSQQNDEGVMGALSENGEAYRPGFYTPPYTTYSPLYVSGIYGGGFAIDFINVPLTSGWTLHTTSSTNTSTVVWGDKIGADLEDIATIAQSNFWPVYEPTVGDVVSVGFDVETNAAVVKWLFEWFR